MQEYEADGVLSQFTANQLALRELDSFPIGERVEWLKSYPSVEVGFIPSGRGDASAAFRYIHHAAQHNDTAADSMQSIRMAQMFRADADQDFEKADA